MKKLFLLMICMMGFAAATHAQNNPQSKPDAEKQKAKVLEQIVTACKAAALTDEEIGKVKTIIADFGKRQTEIKGDSTTSEEVKKTKLKEANSQKDRKMQDLMGKDRYKVYADTRKKLTAEEEAARQKNQ